MPQPSNSQPRKSETIPWDQRPHLRMTVTTDVTGLSPTTIYRLAAEGKLTLRRIAGRVVVETPGVVALVQSAEPWKPGNRGGAARAKRAEAVRASWRS